MIATVEAIFARHAGELDREMRSQVPLEATSGLYRMIRYHLGWVERDGAEAPAGSVGKRLRPTLLLLAAEACGGDAWSAMPAAAAIELVHNFSLVHDDIQDRSDERRGRDAVWSLWGGSQAINAGDALHAIASRGILRVADRGLDPETAVAAAILMHDCCLRLVEGQYLDLDFESRDDVTRDDYLRMIAGKTGALVAAALQIGALLGRATHAERWLTFGERVGRAFQITDDILGVWGDPAVTGKPRADDVFKGKRALPFLIACERLDSADAIELRSIYQLARRDDGDAARAIALMDSVATRAAVRAEADVAWSASLEALAGTDAATSQANDLRELARFVVDRDR